MNRNTMRPRVWVWGLLARVSLCLTSCSANPVAPMPDKLIVELQGTPATPVHVSVDHFNVYDGESSTVGLGARVYYIGDSGSVRLKDLPDGYNGIRVQVCNPLQRKLSIVGYDDKTEVARKESNKRGEVVTLDVGKCPQQTNEADLTDFSLEPEDLPRIDNLLNFVETQNASLLNLHQDSPAVLTEGIVRYVRETHGKPKAGELADWMRVELNGGKDRELLGVIDFERGPLVVGMRIQANGSEVLRMRLPGSLQKAYQSNPIEFALQQWAVGLSKGVFDVSAPYPLSGESDAKFNAGLRQDYGAIFKAASIHKTKWIPSVDGAPIECHVECEIQSNAATYYLVHVFELDPHRLSSFTFLAKRRFSENSMLD